jgi:drug/metabolite transporter (DMT)-like permease
MLPPRMPPLPLPLSLSVPLLPSAPPAASSLVWLGLGASGCWALANVAVQRGARRLGTVRALLWAQVLGGLGLAVLAALFDQRSQPFTVVTLGWLAGAGCAALVAYLCMFYAFQHGRLSIAVPIMSGWAVISSAISVGLFHERVRPLQLIGSALVIGGMILVSRPPPDTSPAAAPVSGPPRRPRWMLAALGATLGFGILIPSIGRLTPATGRLGAVCAVYAMDILLGLPLAVLFRVGLAPPPRGSWRPVALAALFETGGFACIALAVGRAPMAVVSPLASLASALTVLYAWVILRDRPPRLALMGAALASIGVVVLAL